MLVILGQQEYNIKLKQWKFTNIDLGMKHWQHWDICREKQWAVRRNKK